METMADVEDLQKKVKKNIRKKRAAPKRELNMPEESPVQESDMVDLTSDLKKRSFAPPPVAMSRDVEFINQEEFLQKMKNDKSA